MTVDLQKILDKQKELHDYYAQKQPGSYYHHGPFRYPNEKLVLGMQAIDDEFAEMKRKIPWKWWKEKNEDGNYKTDQILIETAEDASTQQQLMQGVEKYLDDELIDVAHFFFDMLNYRGITAQKFLKLYSKKNKINKKRQKGGY